jgi:hypothetical protein
MRKRIRAGFLPGVILAATMAMAGAATDLPAEVMVDTGETLALETGVTDEDRIYQELGEWNTAGDAGGWNLTSPGNLTVSNGVISLTEAEAPLLVETALAGADRTDLDLGYNDYLWIRCKLPQGSAGDLRFSFTTTLETAESADKSFVIPAARLIADGGFHEYIVDLGLVRRWRGLLAGIRMEPFSSSAPAGRTIELDFLRIGDLASETLGVNTNLNFYTGENLGMCSRRLSKHFSLWWSPESQRFLSEIQPSYPPFDTDTARQRICLRMCEETWQYFRKVLGYADPTYSIGGAVPGRFKENITTWWHGGFGAAHAGFPTINVHAPSMTTDEAGNPIRHEYGHSVQAAMPGYFNGAHWESHVGYMHVGFMSYWGEVTDQGLNLPPLSWINYVDKTVYKSCLMYEWPGFVYADRRPYGYLDTDPDNFGLPADLTATMWATPPKDQFFPDALRKHLPSGVSLQDLTLGWSRRIPFFDFPNGADERDWFYNVFQTSAREQAVKRQRMGMILAACPDRPGWWHSTSGTAPMALGYSFYELERPAGGAVTAQLNGIDIAGSTEDWRWCLVATTAANGVRYSGFAKSGDSVAFDLTPAETGLWLVVAGTPASFPYNLNYRENVWNLDKHPGRMRYPFEIQLQGTGPKPKRVELPAAAGHTHANGGGFVANSATVDATAYVGPSARVMGTAKVLGQARIEGSATVVDATVRDSARVSGSALVYGTNVTIRDQARVRDRATAHVGVTISGNALLADHACVGAGIVSQNATARGISETYTSSPHLAQVSGHAILDGDFVLPWNAIDGVHKTHVPWGDFYWDYYARWLKKPDGMIARYRVEETDGDFLWDTFGSLHALLRGKPQRAYDLEMLDAVLVLDGQQQYAVLDPSMGDSSATSFAAWCNLDPANPPDTPLLFLGYRSSEYVALVPANSAGKPELVIQRDGGTVTRVTAPAAISNQTWTHLGFTLDGGNATLFVNGAVAASAACDLTPCALITPDIQTTPQANYVGRGWSGDSLNAKVDDIRCYNIAIPPAAMARIPSEKGRALTVLYNETPLALAADSTEMVNSGIVSPEECTIFVEVNPELVDDVGMFRPILDSHSDNRQIPGPASPAVGIDDGKFVVYLQGSGRWDTGVPCAAGVWQQVALTYGKQGATLFVNGAVAAFRNGQQAFPREVTFLVGCSRLTAASRFVGSLRNLSIHDRALDRDEVLRTFGTNVYAIEASTTYGGTISPAPEVIVNAGGSQTFTITPYPGFSISSLTVDGGAVDPAATHTFSNVTARHSISAAFTRTDAATGSIVRQDQLLFACLAESLPASGQAGPWSAIQPSGTTLAPMNSPMMETLGGKRWVRNLYAAGNGFDLGQFNTPIPCDGATIIAAVRPVRNDLAAPFTCIVSAFHTHLALGIRNDTGAIFVSRNGVQNNTGVVIPDGQMTILSLVVQPDGKYKVFADGTQVVSITATSTYASIAPGPEGYMRNINLGRNHADTWSTFNGSIGDVFFYKTALSETERQEVENGIAHRLTQAPPELAISPLAASIPAEGGSGEFQIDSNTTWSWSIVGGGSWFDSTEAITQTGSQTFTYQIAPNPSTSVRAATLVLSGGGITRTHTITCAGVEPPVPLTVTQWRSENLHGTLTGALTIPEEGIVEPRTAGLRRVVVAFSKPIVVADPSTAASVVGVSAVGAVDLSALGIAVNATASGDLLAIEFAHGGEACALPDGVKWRFTLNPAAITASDGENLTASPALTRPIASLAGDVDGNGRVTGLDLNLIDAAGGFDPLLENRVKADVNGDGSITAADHAAAWANRSRRIDLLQTP